MPEPATDFIVAVLRGDVYAGQVVNVPADETRLVFYDDARAITYYKLNDGNFHAENSPAINGLRAKGWNPKGGGR